jgi:hypothetical protein
MAAKQPSYRPCLALENRSLFSTLKLSFYRLYSSSIFILVTGHTASAAGIVDVSKEGTI